MRLIDVDALLARMATVYHDTDLRAHYTEVMRAIMDTPTVHSAMTQPVWYCWAGDDRLAGETHG